MVLLLLMFSAVYPKQKCIASSKTQRVYDSTHISRLNNKVVETWLTPLIKTESKIETGKNKNKFIISCNSFAVCIRDWGSVSHRCNFN